MSGSQSHPLSSGSFSDVGRAPTEERMRDIQSEHKDMEDYDEDNNTCDVAEDYDNYDRSVDLGYLEPDDFGGSWFN